MLNFISTHSRLVCEVPLFRGELEANLPEFYISPYSSTSLFLEHKFDFLHIFALSGLIADEAQILIQKIHDVLRLQATELLVFIISDKDRLQHSESPNRMPIAYALKDRCLSNHELRFLINKLRDTLLERQIKVLCEIYDGQWQYTVMHDEDGNPLNRQRVSSGIWSSEDGNPLNRQRVSSGIWSRISKLSKSRVLDELMTVTTIWVIWTHSDLVSLGKEEILTTMSRSQKHLQVHCTLVHLEGTS